MLTVFVISVLILVGFAAGALAGYCHAINSVSRLGDHNLSMAAEEIKELVAKLAALEELRDDAQRRVAAFETQEQGWQTIAERGRMALVEARAESEKAAAEIAQLAQAGRYAECLKAENQSLRAVLRSRDAEILRLRRLRKK